MTVLEDGILGYLNMCSQTYLVLKYSYFGLILFEVKAMFFFFHQPKNGVRQMNYQLTTPLGKDAIWGKEDTFSALSEWCLP